MATFTENIVCHERVHLNSWSQYWKCVWEICRTNLSYFSYELKSIWQWNLYQHQTENRSNCGLNKPMLCQMGMLRTHSHWK